MADADFEKACGDDAALAAVHQLISGRDYQQARVALEELEPSPGKDVAELRLDLEAGADTPELVMQRLVQLMRRIPNAPAARELYARASTEAYGARSSSPSHSHPYLPRVIVEPKPGSGS